MSTPKAERKKAEGNDAFGKGDFGRAAELYSEAIQLDDLNHVFYANRAAALLGQSKYEEARADSLKCIELNAEFPKAYLRLATAEKALGNKKAALEAVRKGINLFPKDEHANAKKAKKSGLSDFQKLEKELKRELEPIQRGPQPVSAAEQNVRNSSNEVNMQSLGQRVISSRYKLQDVAGRGAQRVRDHQSKQIILRSLETSLIESGKPASEAVTYRRMGKSYLLQDCNQLMLDLKQEMKSLESEVSVLNKAEASMKSKLEDAERNLQEFARRQRQQ